MSDAKKPSKPGGKPAEKPKSSAEMQGLFWILVAVLFVFIIIPQILKAFGLSFILAKTWGDFLFTLSRFYASLFDFTMAFSIFFIFLCILGIIFARFKLKNIQRFREALEQREADERMGITPQRLGKTGVTAQGVSASVIAAAPIIRREPDPRWIEIENHMKSSNSSEWRMAILEADIILYEMLDQMGYPGNSIGDKLKQVDPSGFRTLNDAWSAHKVRNVIAHEGSSYVLGRTEAERAVALYKNVFEEFYFI